MPKFCQSRNNTPMNGEKLQNSTFVSHLKQNDRKDVDLLRFSFIKNIQKMDFNIVISTNFKKMVDYIDFIRYTVHVDFRNGGK